MKPEVQTDSHQFVPELKMLKSDGKQREFNEMLVHALPAVKRYIVRSLNSAVEQGLIVPGAFAKEAIIDDVYLKAFDEIDELHYPELFEAWLILKAEEVIQHRLDEKEYENLFLTDLDKYSKAEWDKMEERFSLDGGGDFVMEEEFDDPSFSEPLYDLGDVFTDDTEAELIEHIDKVLSEEEASRHIAMVLQKLPLTMRTTYELIVRSGRKQDEIASLRGLSIDEIEAEFKDAKNLLRRSLGARYLGWI